VERHDRPDAGTTRLDDPWYDVVASGWDEHAHESHESHESPSRAGGRQPGGRWPGAPAAAAQRPPRPESAADVYLAVQHSAAFQEVRGRYRRFVLPASIAFLAWYFAYVIAATAAPGLMARPVAGGPLNVAMLAGLAQFATTFLLTCAYARHARLRRDRAALELRWETQELTREQGR
jgi:uncharacterized membrane protein (DUF485 family)